MSFESAERLNARNWDEFFREDRELARLELGLAKAARTLAIFPSHSFEFIEAEAADRKLRDQRLELWQKRSAIAQRQTKPT